MEPVEWPASLAWIFDHLKPGTHQAVRETPMTQGAPRQRPAGLPVDTLSGEVWLSDTQWTELQDLVNSGVARYTHASRLYSWLKSPPSVPLQQTMERGQPTRYRVLIELRVLPVP